MVWNSLVSYIILFDGNISIILSIYNYLVIKLVFVYTTFLSYKAINGLFFAGRGCPKIERKSFCKQQVCSKVMTKTSAEKCCALSEDNGDIDIIQRSTFEPSLFLLIWTPKNTGVCVSTCVFFLLYFAKKKKKKKTSQGLD